MSGRKRPSSTRRSYGIEVVSVGENANLEEGSILLLRDIITIGRKRRSNTIRLSDQYVSGNHAEIKIKNNEIIIRDLKSTNGIFVNDVRIKEYFKLRANDKFRIGSAIFKVIESDKN